MVLSLLAEDKLNPNIPTKDGLTPLACAVRNGDRNMVDLLLTREDIQVKFGRPESHSPIALAVAGGHYGVMFRLLCFTCKAKYSDNLK
jgi:ankyrin repeat protein